MDSTISAVLAISITINVVFWFQSWKIKKYIDKTIIDSKNTIEVIAKLQLSKKSDFSRFIMNNYSNNSLERKTFDQIRILFELQKNYVNNIRAYKAENIDQFIEESEFILASFNGISRDVVSMVSELCESNKFYELLVKWRRLCLDNNDPLIKIVKLFVDNDTIIDGFEKIESI